MANKKKKITAFLLIVTFLGLNCSSVQLEKGLNVTPRQKRGAEILLKMIHGQTLRGELITVKENSLLLLSSDGADISVYVKDIKTIILVKKSKAFQWGGITFLLSSGIAIAGATSIDEDINNMGGGLISTMLYYALLGFVCVTTLTAACFGALVGIDKKIRIIGRSEKEIMRILDELRKKARVRNFQ